MAPSADGGPRREMNTLSLSCMVELYPFCPEYDACADPASFPMCAHAHAAYG